MVNVYKSPDSYYLIYVYELPGSVDHAGILKVGDTSFESPKSPAGFPPNCSELREEATRRIKEQTNTAGIKFKLHYVELAVRTMAVHGVPVVVPFRDHEVHDVLEKSGFKHVKMAGTTAREWYRADLETIKKCIAAVKEGRIQLNSSELKPPPDFAFRAEQEAAIRQTLARFRKHNDMLWDAKMRFGKTPTALEVVLRGGFRRTIIITHRPVVGSSWEEDFGKIFPKSRTPYLFVDKTKTVKKGREAFEEADKKDTLRKYDKAGKHFIYFASIQDLRGSKCLGLGGGFPKNESVFDMDWDLIIVDEAHEGTQTDLGKKVSDALRKKETKVLSLSGTPFNILASYEEDAVFVWDYTMEQATKKKWAEEHPDEPNPYAVLPRLNIFTFDLAREITSYAEEELEGKAFNFTEFFRVWEGDKEIDGKEMPAGVTKGDFVHAEDVRKFLDLISTDSDTSRYPFSTQEYCDFFRHSLWMVPGVAAAKALSAMLKTHKVFKTFGIANVAGEGDDYEEEHYEDALAEVREKIKKYPRTITLSCGKLTTGVTVPEWTAVLMIAGSVHTAAASYMQTIFRVQSPWVHDGKCKTECYVFDFAPDRTLTVLAETAQLSRKIGKDTEKDEKGRAALREFMNFCPVISIEGGRAKPYDVQEMMRKLKHVFVMKAIRNGFDDVSLYNNDKLMKLGKLDLMKFDNLEKIVGRTKQTEAPNSVDLNNQGFDQAEFEQKKKEKEAKLKRKLTPEEEKALKERREEQQKAKNARSILRAISIRMPLLIFGADVPVDEKITLERFVKMVDEDSWAEFMPKGVTKKRFMEFIEYYDRDVFEGAGLQIRRLAKAADKMLPGPRVQQIARIFSYFKNPDKETVLTPWRVVNMHLSDTLGGWCFLSDSVGADHRTARGRAVSMRPPHSDTATDDFAEPRFVDRGEVTSKVFDPKAKILEINSKSGLYPLYVTYSIYRRKFGAFTEADIDNPLKCWQKWKETVADNVFVICKTPMAAAITRRTLVGYMTATVNARTFDGDLIETLKTKHETFTKKISTGKFWGKEDKEMKFDAIVGNPPYQQMDGGNKASATPIYNYFVESGINIGSRYVSMIIPAKWYSGGRTVLDGFREKMLNDTHLTDLVDYADSDICFPGVDIAGGVCYFLRDSMYDGTCTVTTHSKRRTRTDIRFLNQFDFFVRDHESVSVLEKVLKISKELYSSRVSAQKPFGLRTYVKPSKSGDIQLRYSGGRGPFKRKEVSVGVDWIDKYKVIMSYLTYDHAGRPDKDGRRRIFSTMEVLGKKAICTETYIVIDAFDTKSQAENLLGYLKTKFARFLVSVVATTQHISKDSFVFVPIQDFTEPWDDEKLYAKYGITPAEQKFIESMIKPME